MWNLAKENSSSFKIFASMSYETNWGYRESTDEFGVHVDGFIYVDKYSVTMNALSHYLEGSVIVFICRVTAVCANNLPLTEAPVLTAIMVLLKMTPSKCA